MADVSFHNDPLSRRVMRGLLALQIAALALVLGFSLVDRYLPALLTSLLTLLVSVVVVVGLYNRYRKLSLVRQKRTLEALVIKFQRNLRTEGMAIQAAVQERARLVRCERDEMRTALLSLQAQHFQNGLRSATIRHASIPGVGPKFKDRLAEHGVLTAAQVSNDIAALPGFGEAKCQAMLAWQRSVIAILESTRPGALPPAQADPILKKYQALHEKNNLLERDASASQKLLERELISLSPRLKPLRDITFLTYLSKSLASRGMVAAAVAFVLVLMQLVSSVSATLAYAAGK